MASKGKKKAGTTNEPSIENRKARHQYAIEETLECGIRLLGTEVKSIRAGQASLAEGYVRATEQPLALRLHSVHVAEYPPAGPRQHEATRTRELLAHKREIRKLADKARQPGRTIVPLKIYFKDGRIKILIGIAVGKRKSDKRQDMAKRDAKREMDRAMSRRM
ncbi:MAG: SsrA-binding protein SmpB [Planctomycetota bacterium]